MVHSHLTLIPILSHSLSRRHSYPSLPLHTRTGDSTEPPLPLPIRHSVPASIHHLSSSFSVSGEQARRAPKLTSYDAEARVGGAPEIRGSVDGGVREDARSVITAASAKMRDPWWWRAEVRYMMWRHRHRSKVQPLWLGAVIRQPRRRRSPRRCGCLLHTCRGDGFCTTVFLEMRVHRITI
nr:uncharacterized protein LOC120969360 [Aegilops tauschii subsp. strangulata]